VHQRSSACFDLSVCLQPVYHFSIDLTGWNLIACASFRCLKTALFPFASSDWPLTLFHIISLRTYQQDGFRFVLPRPPRLSKPNSRTPSIHPRCTHVAGKNGVSIPIAKASKQELVTKLEQYSRRHGEYPDNYPGGPQDLSDSDDESSGDELDVIL